MYVLLLISGFRMAGVLYRRKYSRFRRRQWIFPGRLRQSISGGGSRNGASEYGL